MFSEVLGSSTLIVCHLFRTDFVWHNKKYVFDLSLVPGSDLKLLIF